MVAITARAHWVIEGSNTACNTSEDSLRRVFDILRAADLVPRDAEYDRARFSEDSFLKAIAN
jgi:hypothetical protein